MLKQLRVKKLLDISLEVDIIVEYWKGDRVVYGSGLENRRWLIPNREFKSHPFRHYVL